MAAAPTIAASGPTTMPTSAAAEDYVSQRWTPILVCRDKVVLPVPAAVIPAV